MFGDKNKKRKKTSDEPTADDEFEKILHDMEKIVGDAFKTSLDEWEPGEDAAKGFSVRLNSDGENRMSEANDNHHYMPALDKKDQSVDVMESINSISITVEIPMAKKEDIYLEVTDDALEIYIKSPLNPYYKKLNLPSEVKTDTTKATYKNGVLDIEIRKKNEKKGCRVNID